MFSILYDLTGLAIADVFAGSGALGLEALSRGAERAVFVEKDRRVADVIEENVRHCGFDERSQVLCRDALRFDAVSAGPFDLIFCDAPYGFAGLDEALAILAKGLAKGGRIVVEHETGRGPAVPAGLRLGDQRSWGRVAVTFLETDEGENG